MDAQKQRAVRLFTIGEADHTDVKRELARINKLHLQARARLAELTFEQKREVLEVLQAEFTLEKNGQLRILLALPAASDISLYTNVRHALEYMSNESHDGIPHRKEFNLAP